MDNVFTLENVCVLAGMIYSICLHEAAHAYVSDWLGDDTPRMLGKTTFNPIPHIQTTPIFTLVLPIISFIAYGGKGIIGGGACPVNPSRLRNPRRDEFLVALAGPMANLWLCGLCTMLMMWFPGSAAQYVLRMLALQNLFVCVFNLLPLPPLDGSYMLGCLLPAVRGPFRQIGMGQGFFIVYFVGGMVMQQIMPPILGVYVRLLVMLHVQ